jgi:hypothetical protein
MSGNRPSRDQVEIDYTTRSFREIKDELKTYIKRYYPNTYQDFNQSSFGALMLDLVSMVGDQLHHYIDHAANESNAASCIEPASFVSHYQTLAPNSDSVQPETPTFGECTILSYRRANTHGTGLDPLGEVTLRAKSRCGSSGGNEYTTITDTVLSENNSKVVGHILSADGSKIDWFLLKTLVDVESGVEKKFTIEIGDHVRFRKLVIPDSSVLSVVSCVDDKGREWTKVDHLTQDVVYSPIIDPENQDSTSPSIMKPKPVPRRFIVERELERSYISFGHGSEANLTTNSIADPSSVILSRPGLPYVASPKQDALSLISSDSLGVAPSNTVLTITYKSNTTSNSNAAVGTVNEMLEANLKFKNEHLMSAADMKFVRDNLQVVNEKPINGRISVPTTEELKKRHLGRYSSQGRAVTKQDYVSSIYAMPKSYGAVRRASVVTDTNDLRRNLNIYLIGESARGDFEPCSSLIKQNVKTWLNAVRMISDSIDLFDANIINLGLEINVVIKPNVNPQTFLSTLKRRVYEELMVIPPDIGEYFYISEVQRILNAMPEIVRVPPRNGVKVKNLSSGNYSSYSYDVLGNQHPNDSYIYIPKNSIWEIKYLDDISGTVGIA